MNSPKSIIYSCPYLPLDSRWHMKPQRSCRVGFVWVGSFLVASQSLCRQVSKRYVVSWKGSVFVMSHSLYSCSCASRLTCQRSFYPTSIGVAEKFFLQRRYLRRYFGIQDSPVSRVYKSTITYCVQCKMMHNAVQPRQLLENDHRFPRNIEFRLEKLGNFGGELIVLGLEESQKQEVETCQLPPGLVGQLSEQQQEAVLSLIKEVLSCVIYLFEEYKHTFD